MSTEELKSGISKLIKQTDDEKLLRIVFNLMNDFDNENNDRSSLTEEQWRDVNMRISDFENGKSKGYSFGQFKQQIKIGRSK